MQKVGSHLLEVLSQLKLSSRDIACMMNIHYSLVSKWVNGKRPLRYNSENLKRLVEILISLDNDEKSGNGIRNLLMDLYPEANLEDKDKLAVCLRRYLATDNLDIREEPSLAEVKSGKVFARAKVDIYRKDTGRRDALMRLLDTAIELAPGRELLIFGDEKIDWLDNQEFLNYWLEKYKRLIEVGNSVTIIHTVNRQASTLLHTIVQWLPLHLTGKTHAYYRPDYSNNINKVSVSL